MQLSQNSPFIKWDMTEEEVQAGTLLSREQYCLIQNKLAAIAERQLMLKIDPLNINSFLQQQADLAGQIVVLQSLLSSSDNMIYDLQEQLTAQQGDTQEVQQASNSEDANTNSILSEIFNIK